MDKEEEEIVEVEAVNNQSLKVEGKDYLPHYVTTYSPTTRRERQTN